MLPIEEIKKIFNQHSNVMRTDDFVAAKIYYADIQKLSLSTPDPNRLGGRVPQGVPLNWFTTAQDNLLLFSPWLGTIFCPNIAGQISGIGDNLRG